MYRNYYQSVLKCSCKILELLFRVHTSEVLGQYKLAKYTVKFFLTFTK